jgi:hypothetical protein
MTLCKLGFITKHYVSISKHPIACRCKHPISKFSRVGETVYRRDGRVHLWLYVNKAPLCVNMTEDRSSQQHS